MATLAFKERPEFIRGEQFERSLSWYLQARGWSVLPVYNYAGTEQKAPALEAHGGDLVLPDLLGARAGVVLWCEAKRKARADLTRVTGRLETGLSLRLLDQYREVKARTGIDVWIFFGHELEDEVRCCEIDKVRWRAMPQANGMGRGGMAFVGWDDLAHFVTFSTVMDGFEMARRMDGA